MPLKYSKYTEYKSNLDSTYVDTPFVDWAKKMGYHAQLINSSNSYCPPFIPDGTITYSSGKFKRYVPSSTLITRSSKTKRRGET